MGRKRCNNANRYALPINYDVN